MEKLPLELATTLKYAPASGVPAGLAMRDSEVLCAASEASAVWSW